MPNSGDFSASQVRIAISKADQMWSNEMMKAEYTANTEVFKAIKKEQNAKVEVLQDKNKDRDARVTWVNACGEEVQDKGAHCEIGGPELSTDSKDYSLDFDKQWSFSVDEEKFRTNDYSMEEIVAKGFLRADKLLSEQVCKSIMGRIEAFRGVNQINDGIGVVNGFDTDVQAADWNERMFAYLYRLAIQNQFGNAFLLSGTNLFEDRFIAKASQGNGEGKGAAKLYETIRTYYDLFNVDPVNSPNLKSYMINRGALAFASKSKFGRVPTKYFDRTHYSIASRNLSGVDYDVKYTNVCENDTIMHKFTISLKYDLLLNPSGCDNSERTGVLAFNKI